MVLLSLSPINTRRTWLGSRPIALAAFRVFATLKEVINRNADAIGEIMADAINRNREGQQ